ncbi:hypothetical protein ACS0TY_021492 [Phlomoides rotata]
MSTGKNSGSDGRSLDDVKSNVIVVAVKASNEISRSALIWALTNVVQQGDCVRLLVIIPSHTPSKRLWGFPNFHNDCTDGHRRFMSGTILDQKDYITDLCNEMMCELRDIYDPIKVKVKMKMFYESKDGVVASEAKRAQTQWVVLDKEMKKEASFCMEQLDCNVIIIKKCHPSFLRLNLIEPRKIEPEVLPVSKKRIKVPNVTPTSSPDRLSSTPSLDMFMSLSFMSEINLEPKVKQILPPSLKYYDSDESDFDSDDLSSLSTSMCSMEESLSLSSADECAKLLKDMNVREMISLSSKGPPDPPPLCSVCKHKTPSFGKPPRLFAYSELERATDGFSVANFLAEGGYGSVHRGTLPDGQVIAVKQHKLASSQGDREFCSEVEVLSCAQHRNVVMLIGYCVENRRRLLIYEYICNGSLDFHIYGCDRKPLDWASRQKVAIGAARGLRYLHEECRVGCIVHRDMRPNNILLTHDFEPLVGDFGLARLVGDGETSRIIGTFGYLAPEYVDSGQVSEKADVYSFGVVLLQLVTGRKAVDINRPKGEQCLTEWARPLLEQYALSTHVDPGLNNCYSGKEVEAMLHCASFCLQRDPHSRPPISQVVKMLEGDSLMR